jgi:hypothetical protein
LSVILFADVAQQAEQLFRKQQVAGSSPAIGSTVNTIQTSKSGCSADLSAGHFRV